MHFPSHLSLLFKIHLHYPYHTSRRAGLSLFLEVTGIVKRLLFLSLQFSLPAMLSYTLHIWLVHRTESILKIGTDFYSFLYLRNITMCFDSRGCSIYVKFKIFCNVVLIFFSIALYLTKPIFQLYKLSIMTDHTILFHASVSLLKSYSYSKTFSKRKKCHCIISTINRECVLPQGKGR